jgi:hypothetical protein
MPRSAAAALGLDEAEQRAVSLEHLAMTSSSVDDDPRRSSISVSSPATAIESSSGK